MSECTVERFLRDVKNHQLTIIRDDGVDRHIRLKKPGTSCYYFDIITWPGYLCITGDMGTYVFSRIRDMFEFFRTDREHGDGELPINRPYWAEKLQAVDCSGGKGSATEFDEAKFERVINEYRVNWIRRLCEDGASKEDRRELWEAVENEVLSCKDDGEHRACAAAYDFSHKINGSHFYFDDLFEYDFTRYTFHFTWICYALTWAIKQYDEAKKPKGEA